MVAAIHISQCKYFVNLPCNISRTGCVPNYCCEILTGIAIQFIHLKLYSVNYGEKGGDRENFPTSIWCYSIKARTISIVKASFWN